MKKVGNIALLVFAALFGLIREGSAGTNWDYDAPAGPTPVVINDNWDGGDITVTADDDHALYEVGNVGDGVAGDLEITSDGLGNASLLFGSKVTSVDDTVSIPPKPPHRINFKGDATLRGKADANDPPNVGSAILKVTDGTIVSIAGLTTLKEYSQLTVEGTGPSGRLSYFLTGELLLKGKAANMKVGVDGYARVFGAAAIDEGTLEVEGGLDLLEGMVVDGKDSILHMKNTGRIDLTEDPDTVDKKGKGIWLENGGQLRASGTGMNVIFDSDAGKSYVYNKSGHILVDAGADLSINNLFIESNYSSSTVNYGTEVNGTLTARNITIGAQSTTLVTGWLESTEVMTIQDDANIRVEGRLHARDGYLDMTGGTINVIAGGQVIGNDLRVQDGTMNVFGSVTRSAVLPAPGELNVSGGTVNVEAGGTLDIDKVSSTGADAKIVVKNAATIVANTELKATAGSISLEAGSIVGEAAGLATLHTSGTGAINVHTGFKTQKLLLSGGSLNLYSGTVEALDDPDPAYQTIAGGELHLYGGNLVLNDDLVYNGGGIYGHSPTSKISMSGNSISTAGNSIINAESSSIFIDGVKDFTLGGSYLAGASASQVTMLQVTGMKAASGTFSVTSAEGKIQLSRDLQALVNSQSIGSGVLILKTDAENYIGDVDFKWDDDFFGTYEYKVMKDAATGEYGLYVTNSVARSREEQRNHIWGSWRNHPDVLDDGLPNVLNDSMVDAIVDGTAIRIGRTPGYDGLSRDGKFNAGVLSTLRSPSTASYDALMLYNGSGLGMANNAVLNNNQQTLKRLGSRNSFIRREMDTSCVLLNPGCDFEIEEPDFEPGNRLWVTGNYTSDTSGHHVGFSGYKYRGKGLLMGYDRLFGQLAVGAAFSYMTGDFTDSSAQVSDSAIDTYGGYLYGTFNAGNGLFLSGAAGYAYSDNQIRDFRMLDGKLGWNTADYGTTSYLASIAMGVDWQATETISLVPSIGLSYVRAHASSHSQFFTPDWGGGGANTIDAGKVKGYSSQVPLDLAVRYDWYLEDDSHFMLTGNVGYAYELNNKGARGRITYAGLPGVGPVRIASRELGRHVLNLGVSGKYLVRQYEFGFGYDYTGRKQYNSHTFLLNAGVVF